MKVGKQRIRLLVCDLDNTLYDWVGYFTRAFYAMVDETIELTGCDRDRLLDDLRAVHQEHHDSEHPFALLETRIINEIYSDLSLNEKAKRLDSAFYAFNKKRKETLRLYPGVAECLKFLIDSGVVLVAHTESKMYAAMDRLLRLDLMKYFRTVYCRERPNSRHPDISRANELLLKFPLDRMVELPVHERKPNPAVLLDICKAENFMTEQTAYVGDSMARDMLMAKEAGVFSIWAKYGTMNRSADYAKLVRVTHWTAEDVIREKRLSEKAHHLVPDRILTRGFLEMKPIFLSKKALSGSLG